MRKDVEEKLKAYLQTIGKCDRNADHINNTSKRFLKYLDEYTQGYEIDIKEEIGSGIFNLKEGDSKNSIIVKDIDFTTICIHHLLPFYGQIEVEYKPINKIFGLSKIPRICDILSKRFSLQEHFTQDIADTIFELIDPEFVRVKVIAQHCCVSCRGIKSVNAKTITEVKRDKKC